MENQIRVIISNYVFKKLKKLLNALIDKDYFAFEENAQQYVSDLINFINTIPQIRHYPCSIKQFGNWYCKFKANKHTIWYITFDTDGATYLIKNIINNHTRDYADFIQRNK